MFAYLTLCACLISWQPQTSNPALLLDAVVSALAEGDAEGAGLYFDSTVELVLPGVEDILTRKAATQQLKNFFAANPTESFARVHGGTSNGEAGAYVIGTLTTTTGRYRVYVYGKGAAQPIVQELRIESE